MNDQKEVKEITVARALRQLGTYKDRIEKKLGLKGDPPIGFAKAIQKGTVVPGFKSNEDYIKRATAEFQSVSDLIMQRNKLKAAIVQSNATTLLKINGKSMTVAEAIEHKTGIEFDKRLLETLKTQFVHATKQVEKKNALVEKEAHTAASQVNSENNKADDYQIVFNSIMEKRGWDTVSLPNIIDDIERIGTEIEDFETEVDLALDESNATTKISIV